MFGVPAAIICLAGCGGSGEIAPDVVAQVGNFSITKAAFQHWLVIEADGHAVKQHTRPVVPDPPTYTSCVIGLKNLESKGRQRKTEAELQGQCEKQYKELKQQVLEYLIPADWEQGEVIKQGIDVNNAEVEAAFDSLKKRQYPKEAEFQKALASAGETTSDLLWRLRIILLSRRLKEKVEKEATKRSNETAVLKYYKEHEVTYDTPEKRDVQIVLTRTETQAKQAKREIRSGKDFESVARRKSIDPTVKANGGLLDGVTKGENEQAFTNAVFAAKTGVLGGPIETPFGYYIYDVKAVHASVKRSFAQAQMSARKALVAEESEATVAEVTKKWRGVTKCRPDYEVEHYCGGSI